VELRLTLITFDADGRWEWCLLLLQVTVLVHRLSMTLCAWQLHAA
jgi:hypothetical protein